MQVTTNIEDTREVAIRFGNVQLPGDLIVPSTARAIVIFAHGTGSSRKSARNRKIARALRRDGKLGTLLFDLLTAEEELADLRTSHLRFDIELLAERVRMTTDWLLQHRVAQGRNLAYFGASTGAAAALVAAARNPQLISATVSRSGRPDLAGEWLAHVRAPSLFIVGGNDAEMLRLNRMAYDGLPEAIPKKLVTIPGASHTLEEPGTLELVVQHTRDWLVQRCVRS